MSRRKASFVEFCLLTCSVTVAAAGCCLHRTGTNAEHGNVAAGYAIATDCGAVGEKPSKSSLCWDDQAAGKPELLPWRSRLKGCRLGARLFHGRDSTSSETALTPPPEPVATSSDDSKADNNPSLSARADHQQPPGQVAPSLESNKPDPVVD
jgi:hypothetical protein